MNLYFLRHGKACERSPKWKPDSTRPLTRDGEKKMFEIARGMKALGLSFDLILTSPYIRAFRTAEIVGEVFESKKMIESRNLIPGANPRAILAEIHNNFAGLSEIALVGHEPFLSGLMSVLLSGGESMSIELRKGGCGNLVIHKLAFGQCATLDWLMTPRQLARLPKR
jgi:phosphohistidine phosphatase